MNNIENDQEEEKSSLRKFYEKTLLKFKKMTDFLSKNFYKFYNKFFKKNRGYKQLILWYLLIIMIGAMFLSLSFTKTDYGKNNMDFGFLDVLFISSSAFSDTGLATFSIGDAYNFIGQFIIFILIMLGGIGWFTFKYFLITLIFLRKGDRAAEGEAKMELGEKYNEEAKEIIKVAVLSMFFVVFFFGSFFGIYLALVEPKSSESFMMQSNPPDSNLQGNWGESFWTGFFHANSSVNNAGFDIFSGGTSLEEYYGNYIFQMATLFLFIFGGIGFAVIYDVKKNLVNKSKGQSFKFSLFTKLSVITYFTVAFVGLGLVYLSEGIKYAVDKDNSFLANDDYGGFGAKFWALTFNTFSTRNAGFSTINLSLLSTPSKIINIFMMFIGSGPGSTAGGIRTTTTAILMIYFASFFLKKEKRNTVFNKKISENTIALSLKILVSSLVLVISVSLIIAAENVWTNDVLDSYVSALYLTASAFGTTGLAIGISTQVGAATKIIIILVMIIGQIGMPNIIKVATDNDENKLKVKKINYSPFLEEDVNIG